MTSAEKYLVVWFEGEDGIFTLADSEGVPVRRHLYALKNHIYAVLSSQEDIDSAIPGKRYAITPELAAEVFGWDV